VATGKRGLRDRAWAVRATLPVTPEHERPAVSRLGQALFGAARAQADAAAFLARIDRRDLERRFISYRDMGVSSRRAASEAAKLERQLQLADGLAASAEAVTMAGCRAQPHADEIADATRQLEHLLGEARETIGDSGEPLRRTFWRGVYRSTSGEYVVLSYDTAGVQKRHRFTRRKEALVFRDVVRVEEKAQRTVLDGAPLPSSAEAGGGGSNV
jgi:hypothetical protein